MTWIQILIHSLHLLLKAYTLDTTIMKHPAELDSLRPSTHTYLTVKTFHSL